MPRPAAIMRRAAAVDFSGRVSGGAAAAAVWGGVALGGGETERAGGGGGGGGVGCFAAGDSDSDSEETSSQLSGMTGFLDSKWGVSGVGSGIMRRGSLDVMMLAGKMGAKGWVVGGQMRYGTEEQEEELGGELEVRWGKAYR